MIKIAGIWKAKDESNSGSYAGSGALDDTAAGMLGLPKGTRIVLFWREKRNDREPDFDVMLSCEERDRDH